MRIIRRKIRGERRLVPELGFPVLGKVHYFEWLEAFHREARPKVYLEVGTESGASLSFADCVSFAVDPAFALHADISRNKPELHQFQGTSDDFFATGMVEKLGYQIDLAFLDGMHQFEFLLRDFMNVERLMAPGSTILMHDCVPFGHVAAEREWDPARMTGWTGDVWKLIPILRQHRPDLEVRVLDLMPSGLVEVTKMDPASTVLAEAYDDLVARYMTMSLTDFGLDRFAALLDLVPVAPSAPVPPLAGRWTGPVEPTLRIAIKTGVPVPEQNAEWGDFHFATSLSNALRKEGNAVRIDAIAEWRDAEGVADFDLVLHGSRSWEQRPNVPSVHWVLYPGSRKKRDLAAELKTGQHVFVSSLSDIDAWRQKLPGMSVSALLQGFDADLMFCNDAPRDAGIVFVGSNHKGMKGGRPIVDMSLQAGQSIRLWGRGWGDHPAAANLVADYLPNGQLGALYRSAEIVLCDHMPTMRDGGYVSNRIFDALACGAPVISDAVAGLPDEFRPYVTLCRSVDDLRAAIASIRAEGAEKRDQRRAFAAEMQKRHSLQHRATEILSVLSQLGAANGRATSAKAG
jgi:hypothetical protein